MAGPFVQPQGLPQAGAGASANPISGIEAFLPVLAGVLAAQQGGGMGGPGSRDTRGMHVPIGPQFQQMYKSKGGSIAAGASTLIGNVLIANKNMGDPMGLPWWLGGNGGKQQPSDDMSKVLPGPVQRPPVADQAAMRRGAAGSQAANILASNQGGGAAGGGMMGMLGGLMGGGGGGEGGGMGGLGSILGLLGGMLG